MIDKHEGVTDWEATARIAMARADRAERELDALRIFCLDHIRETSDSISDLLDAIQDGNLSDMDERYDADPTPAVRRGPGAVGGRWCE